ncbi:MAG TPA: hypothetical protein VEP50_17040 [bacterium]|nr:hypothetical protein [bacterium]
MTLVVLAVIILGVVALTWLRVGTPEGRIVGAIAAFILYYGVATLIAHRSGRA